MGEWLEVSYQEKGVVYNGRISKERVLSDMKFVEKEYPDRNENAKWFLQVVPEASKMCVDDDCNDTQDVPFITVVMNDGRYEMQKIRRNHYIIWGYLKRYCSDVKKQPL